MIKLLSFQTIFVMYFSHKLFFMKIFKIFILKNSNVIRKILIYENSEILIVPYLIS